MTLNVAMATFRMTLLMNSLQILSWMMDEYIHQPKTPPPSARNNCDENIVMFD